VFVFVFVFVFVNKACLCRVSCVLVIDQCENVTRASCLPCFDFAKQRPGAAVYELCDKTWCSRDGRNDGPAHAGRSGNERWPRVVQQP
jgi:hypothetical protein